MRILFLNPAAQLGGAETSLLDLLGHVKEWRPDWMLTLVLGENGPLSDRVRRLGVDVRIEPLPGALRRFGDSGLAGSLGSAGVALRLGCNVIPLSIATAVYRRRLSGLIRQISPDVVHVQGFKMHVLSALSCPPGVPMIWHFHDYVQSRALMRSLTQALSSRAHLGLANSLSVADDIGRVCGRLPVETMYNVLNLRAFQPEGPGFDLDAAAGMKPAPGGTVRIGLAATFARWKGHEVFMQALAGMPQSLNFRAYIIGGPIYSTLGSQYSLDELRAGAERLGLADRLGFTGFLDDMPSVLRSLDVVVHCSTKPEPFGMAIVEGMAAARAVVATRSCGAAEVFEEGVSAFCHEAGDAVELAGCLTRLCADPDLRDRAGRAARKRVEQLFGGAARREQIVSIYERFAPAAMSDNAMAGAGR